MKKSDKTEITISKIIEAALIEFGKNGYAGGTVNNICKTGINKGLLYHNFSGKDDVYLNCLNLSCEKLIRHICRQDGMKNLESYMAARMDAVKRYPDEAHIFFEALLDPPEHLTEEVSAALSEFNELNMQMLDKMLDGVVLRDGISRDDAVSYFYMVQTMLNGCFGSGAYRNIALREKIEIHENAIPRLLDIMLHGIAKAAEY